MTSDGCKIFVNSVPVDALPGDRVIDAIQRWGPSLAEQLKSGQRTLADSRGLPAGMDSPVYAGAIFRIVSNRLVQMEDNPQDDSSDDLLADT